MKSLRKLSLLLLAALFAMTLISCNGEASTGNELTVTVNATDINGDPVLLGEVTFSSDNPTVLEALQAMCTERELALEASDMGVVSKIGDVGISTYVDETTGTNMAIGWSWKLNGKDSADLKSFANETAISSGDTIEYYQYAYENVEDAWFEQADNFESDAND